MTEPDKCKKCGVDVTPEEQSECPYEEMTCRKCIARLVRMNDFKEHLEDDDYWNSDDVPQWEWWAWRLSTDFEDQAALQEILRGMKSDNLTIDDYNKVIELLSMVMMMHKYSQEAYELPR
tara:strand:+ start:521 stop:880 length:360 start_codon:yes stop_codon:yes gene_type:complete